MSFIKGLIHSLWMGAKLPCPVWLALFLVCTLSASATGLVYYAAGGFVSASSTYGPTSATVNGPLTATSVMDSGLAASAGVVCTNGSSALTTAGCQTAGSTSVTSPITNSGTSTNPNIGLSTPLALSFGGTGTATPGNTYNSPLTFSGTWPNYTVGCTSCLTTAGGQNVTLNDNFGGAPGVTPIHTPVITSNGTLAFPATGATSAGSQAETFGWTNGSSVQNEWEIDVDTAGDLCLAVFDTCTDLIDSSNVLHTAGVSTSGVINSSAGGTSDAGLPATNGLVVGFGTGTNNAITIGWENASGFTCSTSCGTANSYPIELCGMSATGPLCQSPFVDNAGVFTLGKLKITNNLNMGANPLSGVGKLTQQAAGDIWGSCTMSSGTSCTITWSYAPTFCGKPNPVGTTVISGVANIASTTITITAGTSNSETWDVSCS